MRRNTDQKIADYDAELAALPIATEEDLDALATVAMSNLYIHCRDKGGRELNYAYKWLLVSVNGKLTGHMIPKLLRPQFQSLCEDKWRNLMAYLNSR